jgi:hypothetical protein
MPPQHEAAHGEGGPSLSGDSEPLIVFAEAATVRQARERPFHDPPARNHTEAGRGQVVGPVELLGPDVLGHPPALVAVDGFDRLDPPAEGTLLAVPARALHEPWREAILCGIWLSSKSQCSR